MIASTEFLHEQDKTLTRRIFAETPFKSWLDSAHENDFDAVCDYVYGASLAEISCGSVLEMRDLACEKFGIEQFKIYCVRDYDLEISCVGYHSPAVLIPNSLIDCANEEILQARLYAAAAAVATGHHRLKFFTWAAENMSGVASLPVIGKAMIALLYEWNRVQQYSLDRAVLLATDNIELALKNILFGIIPQNLLENFRFGSDDDTFLKQTERYFRNENPAQIIGKVFSYFSNYSWLPLRYDELRKFYQSQR